MGYQGFEQVICKNGHYFEREATYMFADPVKCMCSAEDGWENDVDCTNDSNGEGRVEVDSFLISAQEVQTCNLGHSHIVKQAVYRVPTKEETDSLRTYSTTAYKCLNCECSFVWKDNTNDPPECTSCGSQNLKDLEEE